MAYKLGWPFEQTERVRRRVARKIDAAQKKFAGNRKYFLADVRKMRIRAGSYREFEMIEQLESNLSAARSTLSRVQAAHGEAQAAQRQTSERLDAAIIAARADREQAVLKGTKPNPKLSAAIPALENEFDAATEQLQAANGALETARAAAQVAHNELESRREEITRRAFEPELAKFDEALGVMIDAAGAIRKRLTSIGQANLSEIFVPQDPYHSWAADEYWGARAAAFNVAFALLNKKPHEKHWREVTRRPQ
jgi:chromosome segregation ATPase